jgi:thiol-disulfide isomerase/thioredoxin
MPYKLAGLAAALLAVTSGSLVRDTRALLAQNKFAEAEKQVSEYRARSGDTVEVAEAISWLGRGALAARNLDAADRYATQARAIAVQLLRRRKLDDEPHLPLALGAAIEVNAQVLAARGARSEAVEALKRDLAAYGNTSIHERIQKNINLLSLEGKPAPALETTEWLGPKPPPLRGHPTLLFLWAHWCGDCKAMAPTIAAMRSTYGPRGLVVIAPTKLYGYAAGGMEVPPKQEVAYIEEVRKQYYAPLIDVPAPLSAAVFREYGVSSTPTIVVTDRQGIVRLYHPGAMAQSELASRIEAVIAK